MKNILLKSMLFLSILCISEASFAMEEETPSCSKKIRMTPPKGPEISDPETNTAPTFHFLSAEDSPVIRICIRNIIEKNPQWKVTFANNGQECLSLFNEREEGYFALILMDREMPVMDGPSTVQALKASNKTVPPIIGLSASNPEEIEAFMGKGLDAFVSKPVNPKTLLPVVNKYLENLLHLDNKQVDKKK